jgi:hypothetical protein
LQTLMTKILMEHRCSGSVEMRKVRFDMSFMFVKKMSILLQMAQILKWIL